MYREMSLCMNLAWFESVCLVSSLVGWGVPRVGFRVGLRAWDFPISPVPTTATERPGEYGVFLPVDSTLDPL